MQKYLDARFGPSQFANAFLRDFVPVMVLGQKREGWRIFLVSAHVAPWEDFSVTSAKPILNIRRGARMIFFMPLVLP